MADERQEEPILSLVGEKVALGPMRRDLVPLYLRWINDFEVTRTLSLAMRPMTLEAEEAWYDGAANAEGKALFTIYERETLRPIGNTGLEGIDLINRTAEYGILIGEKDCWGKGCGTETTRLMLDYGFNALGLHHVMLRVFGFNERGIRAYTRAGFRVVGRLRQSHRLCGRAHDVVLMDCLATEFEGSVMRRYAAG